MYTQQFKSPFCHAAIYIMRSKLIAVEKLFFFFFEQQQCKEADGLSCQGVFTNSKAVVAIL